MTQILKIPKFDPKKVEGKKVPLNNKVREQLREFVRIVSNLYHDVPFHNFGHASHVIMSASKLMHRIVRPDGIDYHQDKKDESERQVAIAHAIHTSTYGISSDPIMHFAVVFSALIHDVDHTGLPNTQLVSMKTAAAAMYQNRSVAEQNSVGVAWSILMNPKCKDLRASIYSTEEEMLRFRQLVVNAVMATDIADKELGALRRGRWDDAFNNASSKETSIKEKTLSDLDIDRKATIVFEHIIQASDIAHTMQHWITYIKWNRRLFEERYVAWVKGQADEVPSVGWYEGEIGFFDFYIIPLAKKLDKCGVFGVSYHENLNYALANRKEWEIKGHGIVEEFLKDCQRKYPDRVRFEI